MLSDLAFGSSTFNAPNMGYMMSGAGDMNGDGFADVAMGTTSYVYLFYGSSNGLVAYSLQGGVVQGAPPS